MPNLLTSWNCREERHLIIVQDAKSSLIRAKTIKEAGANPVIFASSSSSEVNDEEFEVISNKSLNIDDIIETMTTYGRDEVNNIIDKVFVVLPIAQHELKCQIYNECKKLRIPINTTDTPELCTFTLLSTHTAGDFQMGVTTSGKGCKLASRIKRELVNALPANIGEICDKVGELRTRIQREDAIILSSNSNHEDIGEHDEDAVTTSKLNSLVEEFNMSKEQQKSQRARWLSQIVEYFPLQYLSTLSLDDLSQAYHNKNELIDSTEKDDESFESANKRQKLVRKQGTISLVGSGPGSVSLLTLGALHAIFTADLILADKLVPQEVIDLIPQKRTKLFIARKFPGNAERAQQELLEMGLQGLERGERVVRLKQGDPYIFGRGGEEYNFFQSKGYKPVVLPGITSALAAPVLSQIPATHREVADQVLICTGTGRRGAVPVLPEFVKSRTTVFLMALHRIVELIPKLIEEKNWSPDLPVAIIERASCPDQRIIRTTLSSVAEAVEACGSRPPGLFVTGYACEVIVKNNSDSNQKWVVEEGCSSINKSTYLSPIVDLIAKQEKLIEEPRERRLPPVGPPMYKDYLFI
ncbi:methionine metabolism [Scheffersomyces amazonensis]|uniref:methionine metabolism n=1 Tax=Scheffersomyces amazonensis TaxID=1078765 RepID=UPI00315CC950